MKDQGVNLPCPLFFKEGDFLIKAQRRFFKDVTIFFKSQLKPLLQETFTAPGMPS